MTQDTIIIRSDASQTIGAGHIMRCVALAQEWQRHGGRVTFISRCSINPLKNKITEQGFKLISLTPDENPSKSILSKLSDTEKKRAAWVVIDGYHFSSSLQTTLKQEGFKTLVIDDYHHLDVYTADILLNPNLGAESIPYNCPEKTLQLKGASYALLRHEFISGKPGIKSFPKKAKTILITMGGSDPANVTTMAIKALKLCKNKDIHVTIVAGPANPNLKSLSRELASAEFNHTLLTGTDKMQCLMDQSDMAISAGGGTSWELLYMGVPGIYLINAQNQKNVVLSIEKAGAGMNAGWYHELSAEKLSKMILSMLDSRTFRESLSRKGQKLIDGKGCMRIISHMVSTNFMPIPSQKKTIPDLSLKTADENDLKFLFNLATDPEIKAMRLSKEAISWESHCNWFSKKSADPSCFLYIAVDVNDCPVGQIRFDTAADKSARIDIGLTEQMRNQGNGTALINAAIQKIIKDTQIHTFHAAIKPENIKSIKAFTKAGFKQTATKKIKGTTCIFMTRVIQ